MTRGIVIANTGSPASPSPQDVEAYLRAYLMDPRIRQLPFFFWHLLVHNRILPKRKFKAAERYRSIWQGERSPLIENQDGLCRRVQKIFDAHGDNCMVRCAMSYGEPSIDTALWNLKQAGCDRVTLLPLYPQSAYCITSSVIDAFLRALHEIEWDVAYDIVERYHDNELYLDAVAARITRAGFGGRDDDRLLLSFHSIPLRDERAGDTYRQQVAQTANALSKRLGTDRLLIDVCYQSVFGNRPDAWASPLATDILSELSEERGRVFFCCPGFAVDCLETLYDIPYEIAPALNGRYIPIDLQDFQSKAGVGIGERFVWVPCLGNTEEHARVIESVLTHEA